MYNVMYYVLCYLYCSGSRDGQIHFWKCGEQFRSLEHLFSVPVVSSIV